MFLCLEVDPSILEAVPEGWWKWIALFLAFRVVIEVIVKLTPNKTDNKIWGYIKPFLNFLSLNAPDVDEIKEKDTKK